MTDTAKLADFITANRISMTAERVGRNPNMTDGFEGDHWKCVFVRKYTGPRTLLTDASRAAGKMTTYFSMGYGHHGAEPTAEDVLDCLASDASSVDQADFETWAGDLGYDSDSHKAEKIYKACEHGAARLKRFLGDDLYETLLYNTERL